MGIYTGKYRVGTVLATTAAMLAVVGSACAPPATSPGGASGLGRTSLRHKGTPWTIQCLVMHGTEGVIRVTQIAEILKNTKGIRAGEVFVRHDGDRSRVCYGEYWRRDDKETRRPLPHKRMRADLDLVKQLGVVQDGHRRYPFLAALPIRMPQDDVGDPAWALAHVEGTYTLQVGVFEPVDGFWQYKQAAAEFCALLRERGFDAYYHHTDSSSIVTVGTFGPEALITKEIPRPGMPSIWKTYYCREVQLLQQEELLKHNLLNGKIYRAVSPTGESAPVPSRLVEIPGKKEGNTGW